MNAKKGVSKFNQVSRVSNEILKIRGIPSTSWTYIMTHIGDIEPMGYVRSRVIF